VSSVHSVQINDAKIKYDVGVDGKRILKLILEKQDLRVRTPH